MGGLEYYFSPPKGFNVARARTFAHTQFCTCVEAITLLSPVRCSIQGLSLMSNLRYHSLMAFFKMFFIIIYFRTLSSTVSVSETCYCFCWSVALLWCWRSLFFSSSLTMKALEEKLVPGIWDFYFAIMCLNRKKYVRYSQFNITDEFWRYV
jgi:hypothetical protein